MSTSEVIVVGCGPVGLITALGLGRAGVQVTLVEAEAGPSKAPRALVYHWAVMKGLNQLGLLGTVVSAGLVKHDYSMRVHRTGETVRWSIRELEGLVEYPFNVHLGQDVLTQIVLEQIRRLPMWRYGGTHASSVSFAMTTMLLLRCLGPRAKRWLAQTGWSPQTAHAAPCAMRWVCRSTA
jgi:2-polyprenyl-6-methoxyphenol hydroxylase-like FAD-dependent oxidoreductase